MKIKVFAAAFMCAVIAAGYAQAQENILVVDINYKTNTAELTYTNPLDHPAYITAVMTKADVDSPVEADYLGIAEELCYEKESVMLTIDISDDTEDGSYKFYAFAGGHDGEAGNAAAEIDILGADSLNDILAGINSHAQSGISQFIYEKLGKTFGIEYDGSAQRDKYIYDIKQMDNAGSFSDVDDVKQAWSMASALMALGGAGNDEIADILERYSGVMGIDTADEDYIAFRDDVCRIIKARSADISSADAVNKIFTEAVAVAAVNKSAVADKDKYFKKYRDVLGITELMPRYEKLDALKAARQFDNGALNTAAQVKDKLASVISGLENSSKSQNGSSGGSGGSGGGGGGGGASTRSMSGSPSFVSGTADENTQKTDMPQIFSDIMPEHWAYEPVKALKTMGIINGYEDNTFRPESSVTREEFVKIITEAFGFENNGEAIEFSDVSESDWYYTYVSAAVQNGIIVGVDETSFGTGQQIKRQDAAVILDRMLTRLGNGINDTGPQGFADAEEISDYAKQSVDRLAGVSIINGTDSGFEPFEPVSRAQAAKLVYGCMKYIQNGGSAE